MCGNGVSGQAHSRGTPSRAFCNSLAARRRALTLPVQRGTESIPAVKLGDSNGVSISCVFDDGDFIALYSDACSYR